MKKIFSQVLGATLFSLCSAGAIAAGTGNVNVTGTIDNPSDVDVYAYTVNDEAGESGEAQDRVMIYLDSPNHQVQKLVAYDSTTQAETWATVALGDDGNARITPAPPGSIQYFRVVNVAATNDPNLEYTLYLSNPPFRVRNSNIVSNDGLSYGPWTYFGIEARRSITFSGTMVDQYGTAVPFSPQTLSVGHIAGKEIDQIHTNASGWYNHTVTFPACTGGGMHFGAASSTPSGYHYPEKADPYYFFFEVGPWYAHWPMMNGPRTAEDPFGMDPRFYGMNGEILGAFGFNQDCN